MYTISKAESRIDDLYTEVTSVHDEYDRIARLMSFIDIIQGAAIRGLIATTGSGGDYDVRSRIFRVHDHEGNCFVIWRSKPTEDEVLAADIGWSMLDTGDGPAQYYFEKNKILFVEGSNDYYDIDDVHEICGYV